MDKLGPARRLAKHLPRSKAKTAGAAFEPNGPVRVFLAYSDEDRADAKRLYTALKKAEFDPWMDQEKLLPGQNWARAIERAIDNCDFFIGCFSRSSVSRHGHFQCELACALDAARRVPIDEIFLLPVRLNECEIPCDIAKKVQCADLFPDWSQGLGLLLKAMRYQTIERSKKLKN